ncbi:Putative DNA-binding protein in cluster with Type I restriction-modification system [Bacteroides ovatus]|nr:Putative DNA-binding protein in cluster with Type I restriction-modification system [Bacteroides ovatus]
MKIDVSIAKNYLKENELESMGRLVNAFLLLFIYETKFQT